MLEDIEPSLKNKELALELFFEEYEIPGIVFFPSIVASLLG